MKRGDIMYCAVCGMSHTVSAKQAKHHVKKPLHLICDGLGPGIRHRPVVLNPNTPKPTSMHAFKLEI